MSSSKHVSEPKKSQAAEPASSAPSMVTPKGQVVIKPATMSEPAATPVVANITPVEPPTAADGTLSVSSAHNPEVEALLRDTAGAAALASTPDNAGVKRQSGKGWLILILAGLLIVALAAYYVLVLA